MAGLNISHLIGNVTRDPELKYTQSQTAVCELGLAVNEKVKDKAGNWIEEVLFCDVVFFGRSAEVCGEFLTKGAHVYIQAKLKLDSWEKDGKKYSKLKLYGDRMQMLDRKQAEPRAERSEAKPEPAKRQPAPLSAPPPDEIPF